MRKITVDDKKQRWRFQKAPTQYSKEEVSLVISLFVENLVKITFKSHLYLWKGKVWRQTEGGPIGLRATGSCAKVVMDDWMAKFRKKLEENGVEVFLLTKYVDDVLVIARNVQWGATGMVAR